jgi:hypothetical protein
MEDYFILVPLALTSLAVAVLELRRRPDAAASLREAAVKAAEAVGLTVLFFAANVATGAFISLATRALRLGFISIYLNTDITLLVLSLLQALVYQRWRESRADR